jgi:preprotein translocase subunit SecD
MRDRTLGWLVFVIVIAAAAILVSAVNVEYTRPKGLTGEDRTQPLWARLIFWQPQEHRAVKVAEGLDLRGGLQVLLEADVPANSSVSQADMEAALQVIRNRIDALGVSEPLVQQSGDRRIAIELPGVSDPDLAIATVREQAFLEFVDAGYTDIPEGTRIRTSISSASDLTPTQGTTLTTPLGLPNTSIAPTGTLTTSANSAVTSTETLTTPLQIYHTIISGTDLVGSAVSVVRGQLNEPEVSFQLKPNAAATFGQFTSANNESTLGGRRYFLCIVLDKVVVSCPSIRSAIPDGKGVITLGGNATTEEANKLALQLRSGSLPLALRVAQTSSVGPTLGQDSIRKSVLALAIGMLVIVTFMLLYYRLPGVLADLALIIFVLVVFSLYKLIPVTLTLPGIAGFALSVGVAVDANILIFERMKEELRSGRRLDMAVEAGFDRAWPSIRDSNASTLITCAILFAFGSAYGASIVKGFALTLGLGVAVSLFTGIWVSRTFLRLVLPRLSMEHKWWFGV